MAETTEHKERNKTLGMILTWLKWWFTNNMSVDSQVATEFKESLNAAVRTPMREADIRLLMKDRHDVAVATLEQAHQRLERMLQIILIIAGWVFTMESSKQFEFHHCSKFFLLLAIATLLFGIWGYRKASPLTFANSHELACDVGTDSAEWDHAIARQYEVSTTRNQFESRLIRIRLFVTILLLIVALMLLSWR